MSAVGVTRQTAPSNRSARAWATPPRSPPAIGWLPTNRRTPAAAAAATTDRLVLPTSVTTAAPAADGRQHARRRPDRHGQHDQVGPGDGGPDGSAAS